MFDAAGAGGGSGVLISPDGFALTNFHVTAPCGAAMKCGLTDGKLYDAVIVGIDPVGDVALIQLLGRDDFPVAEIGDSDAGARRRLVLSPPAIRFCWPTTFSRRSPTASSPACIATSIPAGTLLEYADCMQTDAAINPGNSGGPLFDAARQLIGINGRGSFEKRGRVNVGVGYAISINQIKHFLADAEERPDRRSCDARRDGVDRRRRPRRRRRHSRNERRLPPRTAVRRQIVRFAGREITTANALKNVLGIYPSGWRVPLTYRRDGESFSTQVRLMGVHDESELIELVQSEEEQPSEPHPGGPKEEPKDNGPKLPVPGLEGLLKKKKLPAAVVGKYEARRGYANYWYNEQAQQRLWTNYVERSAVNGIGYDWKLVGNVETGGAFELITSAERAELTLPTGHSGAIFTGDLADQLSPPRSGGLLLAINAWQRFIDKGLRRFGEVYYLGKLPHGPDNRVEDCLVGYFEGMETRFFFADETGDLTGIELFTADDADPCEISFSDFKEFEGRRLPHRWLIRHAEAPFAELVVETWNVNAGKPSDAPQDGAN